MNKMVSETRKHLRQRFRQRSYGAMAEEIEKAIGLQTRKTHGLHFHTQQTLRYL